ncbi:DNA recombination protein RmuC [Pedobacter riviphilus]|uniref:DNA recombination protein RmuC n=1 Tax=Pedobacter riviphilus TaxID=2766984 RepID=A0ABX6TIH1_9SPHI|nr:MULTISPECIES: DNA recombination protein RmuC [Pedobacter]NII84377.1 DNA recombination protein RmuC [Pedobacter sp. SG908]NMN38708.1 DNA recombination protein RmuC [Pedobacter sp. SG918]QNR84200.1 DNA recombination protein RmuC [Pedobacter riviphilus]
MEIAGIALLIVILIVLVILLLKKPQAALSIISAEDFERTKSENESLKISLAKADERVSNLSAEKEHITALLKQEQQRLIDELQAERDRLADANRELESTRSFYLSEKEKLAEQRLSFEQSQEKLNKDFELIANKILDEKSSKFVEQNRTNLDIILNPLKENIKAFEDKVEKVYKAESDERNTLKGVISLLMDQSKQIQEDANNLTKALKGDSKKQGNWGEVILEKVLERSGLVRDQEYRIQASHISAEGGRYQPDVVIDLPDNKHLVVDAKVSLVAYERSVSAETDEEREGYIKQHLASIKNHIQELSAKNYQDLYKINSPDFVLLFVPIESSFSIAVQKDAELFNFAWDRRVVIVSPSTLLATLRTIASMWKQERQNRNVMEIARLSGSMYDKFVGFISDMENIGKHLKNGQDAYDKAINKLSVGAGNLTNTSEKIKKLGAKTTKQIDTKYLDLNETQDL